MTLDPGPLADVSVEPAGDQWTLVFIRELRQPPTGCRVRDIAQRAFR